MICSSGILPAETVGNRARGLTESWRERRVPWTKCTGESEPRRHSESRARGGARGSTRVRGDARTLPPERGGKRTHPLLLSCSVHAVLTTHTHYSSTGYNNNVSTYSTAQPGYME